MGNVLWDHQRTDENGSFAGKSVKDQTGLSYNVCCAFGGDGKDVVAGSRSGVLGVFFRGSLRLGAEGLWEAGFGARFGV